MVLTVSGIHVLRLPRTHQWREVPRVRSLVASLVPEGESAAIRLLGSRSHLVRTSLPPTTAGASPTWLGVSASHEGGHTYVAARAGRIAIDACAWRRWAEVIAAGALAFSAQERGRLRTPADWVRAWTTLECHLKIGSAIRQAPAERAPLVLPGRAGRPHFGRLHHLSLGSREEAVCLGLLTTATGAL